MDNTLALQRMTAFIDAMSAHKGSLGTTPRERERDELGSLRERYASGRISLGQFEAQVEVLLRSTT